MDTATTRAHILKSDQFVIDESKKLQVMYRLKQEIRYGHKRVTEAHTESVGEHIYALHCLIEYFFPLEDTEGTWDKLKVHELATIHDISEIETGDIVAYKKTAENYAEEIFAAKRVVGLLPESIQTKLETLIDEFENQSTIEAQFVRAVDKFEPLIHCFNETGKETLQTNKFTLEKRLNYAGNALEPFPMLKRFEEVLDAVFEQDGYYYRSLA